MPSLIGSMFAMLAALVAAAACAQGSPLPPASACAHPAGRTLAVGPRETYGLPSEAARAAQPGDTIVIAAGDYHGDVATWAADRLAICGKGGPVRLFADGNSAQGKAIWVIAGSDIVVEGIDFIGAKVADENGAGIRAEGGDLTVRRSRFFDNENGILGGDGAVVTIERCEFGRNGAGDGQSHNIYIGRAKRLVISASYFHEAKVGHNLKSRARESRIENSYFVDGPRGTSSYLADFPSGGMVYLRGNLFHKGPMAENNTAISFGAEGVKWPVNTLKMVHNTVVMTRSGGNFVAARPTTQAVLLLGNVFAGSDGPSLITGGVPADNVVQSRNVMTSADAFPGADDPAAPRFWPAQDMLGRLALQGVVDPEYASDAPRPLAARAIKAPGARLVGALQAKP
jgi:hypothetical protein